MIMLHRFLAPFFAIMLVFSSSAQAQDAASLCPVVFDAAALEALPIPPRDRAELAARLMGFIPPEAASGPPSYSIGDKETFFVVNDDESFPIQATLSAIGEHIYLWVESANAGAISPAALEAIAREFDTRIYPETRALWGSEANPGFDGDPRIYGVFTTGLGAVAAAYFSSDNSAPAGSTPSGNGHEMFMFNLDMLSYGVDIPTVSSIVAHEFQHMIRHHTQPGMELWVNEGLAEFTQTYLFGDSGYFVFDFIYRPDTQLNTWAEDGSLRGYNYGAALAWMTYFYERYGIEALEQAAAVNSQRGLLAFDQALQAMGEPGVNDLFADWVLANALYPLEDAGVYDYASFSILNGVTPFTSAIEKLPASMADTASQYASDPYTLSVSDAASIEIAFQAPSTVALIPDGGENPSRFMYSNRADMGDSMLTRAFDLTGLDHATLNFRLWYDIEDDWDYGYVMVSADGGASWQILEGAHTSTNNPHNAAYGAGYNGESRGWIDETISLDAFAGQRILLRFEVLTDDGVNRPGMAVDDLEIPELGYFDDFETGCEDWDAAGWANILNHAPQSAWVQVAQHDGNRLLNLTRELLDGEQAASLLMSGQWSIPVVAEAQEAIIIVSPFAPLTTVPMPYALNVAVQ